jgi:hypothetical protein
MKGNVNLQHGTKLLRKQQQQQQQQQQKQKEKSIFPKSNPRP